MVTVFYHFNIEMKKKNKTNTTTTTDTISQVQAGFCICSTFCVIPQSGSKDMGMTSVRGCICGHEVEPDDPLTQLQT